MANDMRVLQVLGSLNVAVGGPAYAVKRLVEHMSALGVGSNVWTFNYPSRDMKVNFKNDAQHFIAPYLLLSNKFAGWNPWAQAHLHRIAAAHNILHVHGHWLFGNGYAYRVAADQCRPIVVSPRGMLEPWALNVKKLKKKVAWILYEKKNLDSASLFHATSFMEAESIRRLGFKQPIALIPNGIDAVSDESLQGLRLRERGKKTLLFLSRVDSKKGLERLFAIWQRQVKHFSDWQLVIAGNGHFRYVSMLKKSLREKGMDSSVKWMGFVEGDAKNILYAGASLFILPTFSENFGNVIGEALSFGVPVITTNGTPWQQIQSEKCGWYTENNEFAIERALVEAMGSSAATLKEMGERGRCFVEKNYSWVKVAQRMVDTYKWLLGSNEKPDWILSS